MFVYRRGAHMKYSLLSYGENRSEQEILELTKKGIKVVLFLTGDVRFNLDLFDGCPLFEFHKIERKMVAPFHIEDGRLDTPNILDVLPADFNKEQYQVEHASLDAKAVIVKASAGTGKTKVMIDRVMYILMTQKNITPKDICMITFTNKAANQMQQKIQKRLAEYYNWTQNVLFLELIEQLHLINISTIDTYLHHFIQKNGFVHGLDRQTNIQSYMYAKKKILIDVINRKVQEQISRYSITENFMPLGMNQLVDFFYNLWDSMEAKGYFADVIKIDVGPKKSIRPFMDEKDKVAWINNIIPSVLEEAKKEYDKLRRRENALCISDVKYEAQRIIHANLPLTTPKFLFVDEFQDTDNSQIEVLAGIANKSSNTQLFVVGDEKQSIYRFRGATDSAFTELGRYTSNICSFILRKNYRTVSITLNHMNHFFIYLAQKGYLGKENEVIADPAITGYGAYQIIRPNRNSFRTQLINTVKERKYRSTCILCRKNYQVSEVVKYLREEEISCQGKMAGTFYRCKPVVDFYLVLLALIYPEQKTLQDNARATAYFDDLNSEQVENIMKNYRLRLRHTMVFNLLDAFVNELRPWKKYADVYLRKHYRLNLQKLIKIIYSHFAGQYASLVEVFYFLDNKVSTSSKEEDEVYPDALENMIEVMTVHQAKGLEWDTVIIPYTDDFIGIDTQKRKSTETMHFVFKQDGKSLKVGWEYIPRKGDKGYPYQNEYFTELLTYENEGQFNESMRVLYVAATRCKRNLYFMMPKKIDTQTWASLLDESDVSRL